MTARPGAELEALLHDAIELLDEARDLSPGQSGAWWSWRRRVAGLKRRSQA